MLRNLFIINLVLVLVAGAAAYSFYREMSLKMEIPEMKNIKPVKRPNRTLKRRAVIKRIESYDVITSNNLFNPARTSTKTVQKDEQKPSPKNQPKLFGTIIIGDKKSAILQDPETRSTKMYSLNESVGGYTISDIQEDRVVLLWSGEEVVVRLREDKGVLSRLPSSEQVRKKSTTTRRATSTQRVRRRRPARLRSNVPPPPPPGARRAN